MIPWTVRCTSLIVVALWLVPTSSAAQDGTPVPRCINCDDPELLVWLQPLDPEAERYLCSLTLEIEIVGDGTVTAAEAGDSAPPLCELRAIHWASATRWEIPESAPSPTRARLPLEFEIESLVTPRCIEGCDTGRMFEHLRRIAERREIVTHPDRDVGPGPNCETQVGLQIDQTGRVTDTKILEVQGDPDCRRVALLWAEDTRWSIAYARGVPVTVWVAQPITISTQ